MLAAARARPATYLPTFSIVSVIAWAEVTRIKTRCLLSTLNQHAEVADDSRFVCCAYP